MKKLSDKKSIAAGGYCEIVKADDGVMPLLLLEERFKRTEKQAYEEGFV